MGNRCACMRGSTIFVKKKNYLYTFPLRKYFYKPPVDNNRGDMELEVAEWEK